jgi:[acyl-carrier-protein] S-malonyltransferase
MSMGVTDYLEIGPGTVLNGLLKKIDKSLSVTSLATTEHIKSLL